MKPIDMKDLIRGAFTVIFVALTIGRLSDLRQFAQKEFARGQERRGSHLFFPKDYSIPPLKTPNEHHEHIRARKHLRAHESTAVPFQTLEMKIKPALLRDKFLYPRL